VTVTPAAAEPAARATRAIARPRWRAMHKADSGPRDARQDTRENPTSLARRRPAGPPGRLRGRASPENPDTPGVWPFRLRRHRRPRPARRRRGR
jgi:hypothetical protein